MSHDQFLEMSRQVSVRPATSIDDLHRIATLRYKGYRCFDSVTSALDDLDFAANCLLLVAETPQRGIVGTVRLLEGGGEIELDRFVDVEGIAALRGRSFVEGTRLVVPLCREALVIKALLCKAFWLHCLARRRDYLLLSSKDHIADFYRFMLMEDLGAPGAYVHARLNNTPHRTYLLHAESAPRLYEEHNHPYAELLLHTPHDIRLS